MVSGIFGSHDRGRFASELQINKPRNQLKLSRKICNLRVSILHYSDFVRYKDH